MAETRATSAQRYTVVFVLGAGHSGSTLLNFLLNGHSQALGLCEVHTIHRYLQLPDDDHRNPLRHSIWRTVAQCWEKRTGVPFKEINLLSPRRHELRSWSKRERRRYVDHSRALFDCMTDASGASVLVDTSHNRWRLWLLQRSGTMDLKIIHLIRDGRALVNSYARKYGSFRIGFRRWLVPTAMGLWLRRQFGQTPWMTLRYEELAGNSEATLRRICDFLEIEYESSMLQYWEHEDIAIGGNRMRWQKSPIRLDERWLEELSPLRRATFALAGGWLNRLCGYPVFAPYRPALRTRSSDRMA